MTIKGSSKTGTKKNKHTKKEDGRGKKTKYDWVAIKQEFFESDFIDVKPFLQSKYSLNTVQSGDAREKTKGWADEKVKIKEQIKQEALKKFKSNLQDEWQQTFDMLEEAHIFGLRDLAKMILEQGQVGKRKFARNINDPVTKEFVRTDIVETEFVKPTLEQDEIINILKHVKLEKGEPTEIVDSDGKSKAKQWLEELKQTKQK